MATTEKPVIEEAAEEIEKIEPRAAHRQQVIGDPGGIHETYVQKPLSFFGKMQFFEVLGRAVDQAMAGDNGLTLGSLFGGTPTIRTPEGAITLENVNEADVFVQGVAKLTAYAPDLLLDLYCIFLGVPMGDRPWVKETMQKHEDDGGLSDEDGVAIMETFIDQNAEAMKSFFVDRILPLAKRTQQRMGLGDSPPSKPSRATRRSTPKR